MRVLVLAGTEEDSDDERGIASSEEAGSNLIEKLRRCECRTCSNGVTWLSILGGGFNEKPHEFLMKQCLCEKTEQPDLNISVDKRACKLHDWECGMGTCNNCSIASRLPWDCPVFNSNTDKVNVWVWEKNEGDSGERTKKVKKRISDLIKDCRAALEAYIPHKVHADYLNRQRSAHILILCIRVVIMTIKFSQFDYKKIYYVEKWTSIILINTLY